MVIAQIVNFLVLVWLLQRFLYRPIVGVIEARENAVKARIDEAKSLQAQAQDQIDTYQSRLAQLEKQRDEYLQQARDEADQLRRRLTQEAVAHAEEVRQRALHQWTAERERIQRDLQEGMIRQVCDIAGKVLHEIAGKSLEDGLIDAFEKTWAEDTNRQLVKPKTVRLSFDPTPEQRERIASLLRGGSSTEIQFVRDDRLILGIEVDDGTETVSFSAEVLLEALYEQAVQRVKALNGEAASGEAS